MLRYKDSYSVNVGDIYYKTIGSSKVIVYEVWSKTTKTATFIHLKTQVDKEGNVSFKSRDYDGRERGYSKRLSSLTSTESVKLGDSLATKYKGQQLKVEVEKQEATEVVVEKLVEVDEFAEYRFDDKLRSGILNDSVSNLSRYVKYYDGMSKHLELELEAKAKMLDVAKAFIAKFDV